MRLLEKPTIEHICWKFNCIIQTLFFLLETVLCHAAFSLAQIDRAAVRGTVTDPSGRVLRPAHVSALQISTGLKRKTTSSADRKYEIPELPVGNYIVTFQHQRFKTLPFVDVEEVISRTRALDAMLQVSRGSERMEVSAASALMDRKTSAVTGLIEREQANKLPLNTCNWASLTAFGPGAIETGGSAQRTIRFAGRDSACDKSGALKNSHRSKAILARA